MIHVVGHTAIDHISAVSHLPEPNASASVLERKIYYGGGAANIAAGIAMLGEAVTLVSAVGGDFANSPYDLWMEKLGITREFYLVEDANTATAFMFTDPGSDQMTFFEWGASSIFARESPRSYPMVHMATADPEYNVQVAEKADFSSFDPGQDLHRYTRAHLTRIFAVIDILVANHHEYAGMCRTMDMTHDDLIAGLPMAVETKGSQGCMLYRDGEKEYIPAAEVTCQDPTGAGDGFRAGFLSAFVRGYDPADCCRIGNITASFVVESPGCQTSLATWEEMTERFKRIYGPVPVPDAPRRF